VQRSEAAPIGTGWLGFCGALTAVGVVGFFAGVLGSSPERAWQAYLVNFVFWTGLALGCVLLSATFTMTGARWGRSVKRLAEAPSAFLPVAFLLFWVLFLGRKTLFPWVLNPPAGKELWLSVPFFFARDGLALLVLAGLALALAASSIQRDRAESSGDERARSAARETVLSPVYGIGYAVLLSLLGFDLIMALDAHWFSTLFGAYYFVGSFYTGLAALLIAAAIAARTDAMRSHVDGKVLKDLATLLFAFVVVTGYLFYVQFLVIWYGNKLHETQYLVERTRLQPWAPVAWAALAAGFGLPFLALLRKKMKARPLPMIAVGAVALAGMWLERFLLVAPAVWHGESLPLGWVELLVTLGFLGLVTGSILLFLRAAPLLPVGDPLFRDLAARRLPEEPLP
jgi:Ni/Fe-hydrogenase subunit HybB-like protein